MHARLDEHALRARGANEVGGRQPWSVGRRAKLAKTRVRAVARRLLDAAPMFALVIVIASVGVVLPDAATSSPAAAEQARVRAHLVGAEAELRAADSSSLRPGQRARREAVIAELARYRERGAFPRNLDFAELTPYFIDDRGVRCAMAHLIETFGGAPLVARVAATANNARVAELAADPELLAWLDTHGMTVAEAARVQPSYQNQVGVFCWGGVDDGCESNLCVTAPGRPDSSRFCTMPCDPAAPKCPTGMQDVQMVCEQVGDRLLCMYPGQTPGTEGWPCDVFAEELQCDGPAVCFDVDPDARTGVCTRPCPWMGSCPEGTECAPWALVPEVDVCQPVARDDGGGCAVSGEARGALALVVVVLLLLYFPGRARAPVHRRRRAATSSGARSSARSTS